MAKWNVQIRSYHVAALLQREIQHRPAGMITEAEALDLFSADHHQKGARWGSGLLVKAGLLSKRRGVWTLTPEGHRKLITEEEAKHLAKKAKWEK
jgi:hypothetical protein